MPAQSPKSALLIAGPTASGKSALALRLARERNGTIINADSMQVYRELRILSARPSAEEEAAAPHRLYGHVSGADAYSVARWLADASREIENCWAGGRLPILCGGTGLYFKGLEEGLAEVPPIAHEVREAWRSFDGDVHRELSLRDPVMAGRLQPADRQRIIRALEVVDATGKSLADWQSAATEGALLKDASVERLFVDVPRDTLYARAGARFDHMMEQGALDEVRHLPPYDLQLPVMKAIGVPELRAHLHGSLSREQAITEAKTATRHYIKRQLTWWRPKLSDWTLLRSV